MSTSRSVATSSTARRCGGEDASDAHLTSLAAKNAEIEELRAALDSETRRTGMTLSELRLTVAAAQQAEKAHQAEMGKVEGDVKRVLAERRALLQKLATIESVEDAVRELYLQMKDRMADEGCPTPEQLQADKKALAGENILVVVGSLHALLKNLWAFKVEAEDDLRGTRLNREQHGEGGAAALRDKVRTLEADIRYARQESAAVKLQYQVEMDAKRALLEESQYVAAAMSAQHAELVEEIRVRDEEVQHLQHTLHLSLEEGKRRDGLVMTNRQLESARHFDRQAQDRELRMMHAAHGRQISVMERELRGVGSLMSESHQLQASLARKSSKVDACKRQLRDVGRPQLLKQLFKCEVELFDERARCAELADWVVSVVVTSEDAAARGSGAASASAAAASCASRSASFDSRRSPGGIGASVSFGEERTTSTAGTATAAGGSTGAGKPLHLPPTPHWLHARLLHARGSGMGGLGPESSEQRLGASATAVLERLRSAAARTQREHDAVRDDDPLFTVIANVGAANKQARSAARESKRELAGGPTTSRAAYDSGQAPSSERELSAGAVRKGYTGLAGSLQPGRSASAALWSGIDPKRVTGLESAPAPLDGTRAYGVLPSAAEALMALKIRLDAGAGPLGAPPGSSVAAGGGLGMGPGEASMAQ
ncbi:hypothetical protein FOA52_002777 [Chlamydomonas sp. UWO 241]|nr:hypothetical protein FOA52_002777 [Chlamydomonas sp. UWO 241]